MHAMPSKTLNWSGGTACQHQWCMNSVMASVHLLHASQSVTFTVAVLPAEESALKTHGGVTNGLVLDRANGVGTPLVTEVNPGAALTNVALFIDTSKAALTPLAEEKYWWCALAPLCAASCSPVVVLCAFREVHNISRPGAWPSCCMP